jgi:hypothetical protein
LELAAWREMKKACDAVDIWKILMPMERQRQVKKKL